MQHADQAKQGRKYRLGDRDGKKMNDKIGNMPIPSTKQEALNEVRKIALDKRGHVLIQDHCNWLEMKLEAVAIMAESGLNLEKNEPHWEKPVAACYGLLCHHHDKCKLYYAVDGLKDGRAIDTCGVGVDKPLFLEVVNANKT